MQRTRLFGQTPSQCCASVTRTFRRTSSALCRSYARAHGDPHRERFHPPARRDAASSAAKALRRRLRLPLPLGPGECGQSWHGCGRRLDAWNLTPWETTARPRSVLGRAVPFRDTGLMRVVSTATCAPWYKGRPLASTSMRRASANGTSRSRSRAPPPALARQSRLPLVASGA